LLVTPDLFMRARLEVLLDSNGVHVLHARSGEEALGLLRDQHADAVISSYRLPGMDGCTLLGCVRIEHPTMRTILTASVASDALRHANCQGVALDAFLSPPVTAAELAVAMRGIERARPSVESEGHLPGRARRGTRQPRTSRERPAWASPKA
jgi:CheY-like chemotaxis protein